ncbi:unnamed protein product [Brassica napus]|uniref:(rape) hypothetical protein n=1 Tax=Brassica napus TaxID=3708 RepID=A0A816IAS4_BRANA|nr:unnamed protein product [Brassica napus]
MPPVMKRGRHGNWADLPPELMSSILLRIGAIDVLENAQRVCRSWRRVCKDPSMWSKIDMRNDGDLEDMDYDPEIICRHAVDRSQGGLVEIDIGNHARTYATTSFFGNGLTNKGLNAILDACPHLYVYDVDNCSDTYDSCDD